MLIVYCEDDLCAFQDSLMHFYKLNFAFEVLVFVVLCIECCSR